MIKNILILVIFFYFLSLLETSFLIYFDTFRFIPSLILISVLLINLFAPHHFLGKGVQTNEWYEKWWGVTSAFIGGFFLDIFSENFFGFYILILLLLTVFTKFFLKKYVRI